jgi:hypothetical protein
LSGAYALFAGEMAGMRHGCRCSDGGVEELCEENEMPGKSESEKWVETHYVDVISHFMCARRVLSVFDVPEIGEFTRENVLAWLDTRGSGEWIGLLPAEDFQAVCGDIEIPWAKEQSQAQFQNLWFKL